MIRGLMITVAAMGLGIAAVGAQQQDAATVLQNQMRTNGRVIYGDFGKMAKGDAPYDQKAVDAGMVAGAVLVSLGALVAQVPWERWRRPKPEARLNGLLRQL